MPASCVETHLRAAERECGLIEHWNGVAGMARLVRFCTPLLSLFRDRAKKLPVTDSCSP